MRNNYALLDPSRTPTNTRIQVNAIHTIQHYTHYTTLYNTILHYKTLYTLCALCTLYALDTLDTLYTLYTLYTQYTLYTHYTRDTHFIHYTHYTHFTHYTYYTHSPPIQTIHNIHTIHTITHYTQVLLILRRTKKGADHMYTSRIFTDEKAIIDGLQSHLSSSMLRQGSFEGEGQIEFVAVDLATLDLEKQVELMSSSSIVVGMHGAGKDVI